VFRLLGIRPALCVEAPRGLQDLTSAIEHHVYEMERTADLLRRSRKPDGWFKRYQRGEIKRHARAIAGLRRLGAKLTSKRQREVVAQYYIDREQKLARNRERARQRRERTKALLLGDPFHGPAPTGSVA
jgi:hypothetical protein